MRVRLNESDVMTLHQTDVGGHVVDVPKPLFERWSRARDEYAAAETELRKFYDRIQRRYWQREAAKTKGHPSSECPDGGYCANCFLETSIVDGKEIG